MSKKKIVIVGGVAGGASAAARLRRLDEQAEIIIFERDGYISFANCGLPYYIGETIEDRSRLILQTPEMMKDQLNLDVRIYSEVIQVDPQQKKVKVSSKERGVYEETFDYLILSPGAKPIKPNIPDIESSKVFTLRNIPDADRMKNYVDQQGTRSAVVIGGGFIGVEMAENLRERNLDVTLVQSAPHILAPFDDDMVTIAEKELQDHGVQLILGDGVQAFAEKESGIDVILNSGTRLHADLAILAIGVKPDCGFLQDSGLEFGPRGHLLVNEHMQTNIEGIYAVGDAIEVVDYVNQQKTAIPLAGPANKQGRIAADHICGLNRSYKGTQGTSIVKLFDMTGASTGNNERTLQRLQIPYQVVHVHPSSHASYYPGAMPMTLKLIFNHEGRVLGAQAFGYEGVDKRIDVIATVIRMNGTIYDLTEMELSYAPPYSSAKDPVNMAAFLAENVLTGKVTPFFVRDLDEYNPDKTVLIDVRTDLEYQNGHIQGAINIPLQELRQRLNEIDQEKEIWVYCQVGVRGYYAARVLSQNGFKVKNLSGGYKSFLIGSFKSTPTLIQQTMNEVAASSQEKRDNMSYDRSLDACGLCCPGPLMQVKASMDEMDEGQILKVKATDPGFYQDIQAWCKRTNHQLLDLSKENRQITARIEKQSVSLKITSPTVSMPALEAKDNKTIVVFSGELDRAIASFIIANGAASMGKKVTLFFTFWGLNILRKGQSVPTSKTFMDKMFSAMMPNGSKKLPLSRMNMLGFGPKMIRKVMQDKNVATLEQLIDSAIEQGVELVACQMSMDVMGIKQEELLDGVKIGGVGYYLGEAEDSNVNLFI